jgi:hypothetical protein
VIEEKTTLSGFPETNLDYNISFSSSHCLTLSCSKTGDYFKVLPMCEYSSPKLILKKGSTPIDSNKHNQLNPFPSVSIAENFLSLVGIMLHRSAATEHT